MSEKNVGCAPAEPATKKSVEALQVRVTLRSLLMKLIRLFIFVVLVCFSHWGHEEKGDVNL